MEQIALDMECLFNTTFPDAAGAIAGARSLGLVDRMRRTGRVLAALGPDVISMAERSSSDTVRAWAAMAIGSLEEYTLGQRLARLGGLADDRHFAVREWAWLAVRPGIIEDPLGALELLQPWSLNSSANVRRFAVEATRPRGVWSRHIWQLKDSPGVGVALLTATRDDHSPYVRRSVGNWLNDAAKTRPDWVTEVCAEWSAAGWAYGGEVMKRALRSVEAT